MSALTLNQINNFSKLTNIMNSECKKEVIVRVSGNNVEIKCHGLKTNSSLFDRVAQAGGKVFSQTKSNGVMDVTFTLPKTVLNGQFKF